MAENCRNLGGLELPSLFSLSLLLLRSLSSESCLFFSAPEIETKAYHNISRVIAAQVEFKLKSCMLQLQISKTKKKNKQKTHGENCVKSLRTEFYSAPSRGFQFLLQSSFLLTASCHLSFLVAIKANDSATEASDLRLEFMHSSIPNLMCVCIYIYIEREREHV